MKENYKLKGKKAIYPTKHAMNLYFKVDRTTAPATAALYILFVMVIVFALSKVMIYDPLTQLHDLEAQVVELDTQAQAKLEQLKDYDQVLEKYVRSTPAVEEVSEVDRLEILALIDRVIRPEARVDKISISENKVLLTFSGVTLGEAADLVSRLDQSPLVSGISVDTAVSTQGAQRLAEAHVYFEVVRGEEGQS